MKKYICRIICLLGLMGFCWQDSLAKPDATPVLHITDLFRPYNDPDDHWDLAVDFALDYLGDIDLAGVLIDSPPVSAKGYQPDKLAVVLMNEITQNKVEAGIGGLEPFSPDLDSKKHHTPEELPGVRFIKEKLEQSKRNVVIHILGSCRDVAWAAKLYPELFAQKCEAVYLNAGTGSPIRENAAKLEYNVSLEAPAYSEIFQIPCPVYWMPCFEEMGNQQEQPVRDFGTHYHFLQKEILPFLSGNVQDYFAYMFGRFTDQTFPLKMKTEQRNELLEQTGDAIRHMWCTAGFLHAAGYSVDREGALLKRSGEEGKSVFSFDPVRIQCDGKGVTEWAPDAKAKARFIFHVRDREHYAQAMTKAMKTLLMKLP